MDDMLFEAPEQLRAWLDKLPADQLNAVYIASRAVRYWSDETVREGCGDNHADIIFLHADGAQDQRMFARWRAKGK